MKKLICLVLSLVCIVSMVACGKSDEPAPTAADENALNAEEKLLVDSIINVLIAKRAEESGAYNYTKYDMMSLRVIEIGDYRNHKEEENVGTCVKVKFQVKNKNDSAKTITDTYYFVIEGAYNDEALTKEISDPKSISRVKHEYPVIKERVDYDAEEYALYWAMTGDFIHPLSIFEGGISISTPYDGIRIGKINKAIMEHFGVD